VAPAVIWVFDVDGCLIDSLAGTSLRPGAAALLDALRDRGVRTVLWSAGGSDYARDRVTPLGMAERFDAFHDKDGRDADGRYRTDHFLTDLVGVVFVDDRPEDLPLGADVVAVSPYLTHNPYDRGLDAALARATAPVPARPD
jgi:phosphoglycolate phosphatase-like HAD superfamily hydrolase